MQELNIYTEAFLADPMLGCLFFCCILRTRNWHSLDLAILRRWTSLLLVRDLPQGAHCLSAPYGLQLPFAVASVAGVGFMRSETGKD